MSEIPAAVYSIIYTEKHAQNAHIIIYVKIGSSLNNVRALARIQQAVDLKYTSHSYTRKHTHANVLAR